MEITATPGKAFIRILEGVSFQKHIFAREKTAKFHSRKFHSFEKIKAEEFDP
jgi:hypothetical protein